jgi:glycerate 2-kinase
MKVQLAPVQALEGPRWAAVERILTAALAAVDPAAAVRRFVQRRADILSVGERAYDLRDVERMVVVGTGKASAPMAAVLHELLSDQIDAGLVIVKEGHNVPAVVSDRIEIAEAVHPVPTPVNVAHTRRLVALLDGVAADGRASHSLVLCPISGGGSALLTLPAPGLTLDDLQALTTLLLRAGATIDELNCVRKHLSAVKGGQLARRAAPARVVALILSDVVGNPLGTIASGPTAPDPTTYADALAVLARYELSEETPPAVVSHLQAGADGDIPETLKPGDPVLEGVQNLIVGDNTLAAQAAAEQAQAEGFHAAVLSTFVEGEAREVARVVAALGKELRSSGRPVARPACLILGGETTVTVQGSGTGGRNQELALAAALALQGWGSDVAVVCLATDGTDGPTDAAGAVVTGETIARAQALGLAPEASLADNDAYAFFQVLGDLLRTGPTRTNVNDLTLVLAF